MTFQKKGLDGRKVGALVWGYDIGSEARMCSNFGLNLHPGRKPAALQWQWYNFATRTYERLRRRFFPRAFYMQRVDSSPRPAVADPARPENKG
jgi:hypothetical protein